MEKRITIILLVPFVLFWHWFEPAAKKNHKGIKLYQSKKYKEALEQFMSAKGINLEISKPGSGKPGDTQSPEEKKTVLPELLNNTASTLYQLSKFNEALEEFSKIDPEKADIPKSDFYYNLGNTFYRVNKFDKALTCYKKSLLINSDDMDSKKNYELTLKKLKDQKKKDEDDKNNKNQDKKKKEQQKQKQNKEEKHKNIMQYLNQKEKKQMEKKKRKIGIAKNEKDW